MPGSVGEARDPEEAVRSYLLYLDDPRQLVDQTEVDRRAAAVQAATDPIDKLKAIAARDRAAVVDHTPLCAAFVAHAKDWADAENIPATAFQAMAVPDDVLRDAGFDLPAPASTTELRQARARRASPRRTGSGVQQVRTWALEHAPDVFTIPDAVKAAGANAATARRAITQLINDGQLARLGPAPDWARPGRAPIRYGRPAGRAAA